MHRRYALVGRCLMPPALHLQTAVRLWGLLLLIYREKTRCGLPREAPGKGCLTSTRHTPRHLENALIERNSFLP